MTKRKTSNKPIEYNDFYYNIKVINTICNTTIDRQVEVVEISKKSDVMIIIGSETSSNTMKLYDIAKKYCKNTYVVSDAIFIKNTLFFCSFIV